MDMIVVIQNEPRDGDIVYLEKDMESFKKRIVELDLVEAEDADDLVVLGVTYYWDDEDASIVGHEVKLPFVVNRWCRGCWDGFDHTVQPDVGDYFECVEEADCEICKPKKRGVDE